MNPALGQCRHWGYNNGKRMFLPGGETTQYGRYLLYEQAFFTQPSKPLCGLNVTH